MVLAIYGEDTYRSRAKLREMIDRFQEKYDPSKLNLDQFSMSTHKDGEIMSAVGSPPFLAERRMVVIEGLAETITRKADAALWAERLTGRGEETLVVLIDTDLTVERGGKNKLFKALEEAGDCHLYGHGALTSREASALVVQAGANDGITWNQDAVQELVARKGMDTWALMTAAQKVQAAAAGQTVTKALVEQYVQPLFDDALFAFLDAVREQKQQTAVRLMQTELKRGAAPGQLLMMLEREVQLLAELKAYAGVHGSGSGRDAARELGLHPFVVKKTLPYAMRLEESVLAKMVESVMRAERRLKRSSQADTDVLTQLVLDLIA